MKCYKRLIFKQFVAHSFWVICRNVTRTFVELCNTVLVHQYGRWRSTKTSGVHFFYKSSFFFTRELAYERINISSNTWNGYTAENQEERLFFKETALLFVRQCVVSVSVKQFPSAELGICKIQPHIADKNRGRVELSNYLNLFFAAKCIWYLISDNILKALVSDRHQY